MITKETCVKIYHCHNEIENGKKLIEDMAKSVKEDEEKRPPTFYNAFGQRCGLELGVPSGSDSKRIFGVSVELGVKVIEEHIKKMEQRLQELMVIAKLELIDLK